MMVLALAAKRLFARDGGDPEVFGRVPPKMQMEYIERASEMMERSWVSPMADPKSVWLFGEPLAT